MTLERIPEIPRPVGITDVKGVVNYLGNLATTLQDHMSMRPEDLQNLVDGFAYSSTTHATTHSNGGTDTVNHDNLAGFVANEHLLTAAIDHDSLLNFAADEHIAHAGVSILAGGILTGGGTIAATRTISLASSGVDHDATTNFVANKHLLPAAIDHDALLNFAANEHIDWTNATNNFKTTVASGYAGLFIGGNVGIGTTAPGARLEVSQAGADIRPLLKLTNDSVQNLVQGEMINFQGYYKHAIISAFYNPVAGQGGKLQLQTYANETTLNTGIVMDNSGNVGIGTTAPGAKVHVAGGDIVLADDKNQNTNMRSVYLAGHVFLSPWSTSDVTYLQARRGDGSGSTHLQLRTFNAGALIEALFIQSTGNVGIGRTNPPNILSVVQNSATDPIADSWTTYASDRSVKSIIGNVPSDILTRFTAIPTYAYQRRAIVCDEEVLSKLKVEAPEIEISDAEAIETIEIEKEEPTGKTKKAWRFTNGEKIQVEIPVMKKVKTQETRLKDSIRLDEDNGKFYKRQNTFTAQKKSAKKKEMEAEKTLKPKFLAHRYGIMIDDPQVPDEIIAVDGAGNRGLDLLAYTSYLHCVIKELAKRVN